MRILVFFLLTIVATPAFAQWTPRFPGIDYLERTDPGPRKIFATKVNLCSAGIRVRSTRPDERNQIVSSFSQSVGAAVSVNGNMWHTAPGFCDPETLGGNLCGVAAGDGVDWLSNNHPHWGYVGFGHNTVVYPPDNEDTPLPGWINEAVAGHPRVVNGGVNIGASSGTRAPRTAVGFSEDETTLFMVVVDGRSGSSIGADFDELGAILVSLGAHNALALDGGGSSTMWTADGGVMNRPSDGSQRTVRNHLAVIAGGSGPPEHCNKRGPTAPETSILRAVVSPEAMQYWGFGIGEIHEYLDMYVEPFSVGDAWPSEPPRLFAATDGDAVYVEDHGMKRHVVNPNAMGVWRFDWDKVEQRSPADVEAMQTGPPLPEFSFLIKATSAATVFVLDNAPALAAEIVSMSFPETGVVGQPLTATVRVRNVGSRTWPASAVSLASSNPRNHPSRFCDGWQDCSVASTTEIEVAPGEEFEFSFAVNSKKPGVVEDCFSLREIQWFSDVAQGGPGDDALCFSTNFTCDDCDTDDPETTDPTGNPVSNNEKTDEQTNGELTQTADGCATTSGSNLSLWILILFVGFRRRRSS